MSKIHGTSILIVDPFLGDYESNARGIGEIPSAFKRVLDEAGYKVDTAVSEWEILGKLGLGQNSISPSIKLIRDIATKKNLRQQDFAIIMCNVNMLDPDVNPQGVDFSWNHIFQMISRERPNLLKRILFVPGTICKTSTMELAKSCIKGARCFFEYQVYWTDEMLRSALEQVFQSKE